jgi:SAM-dependent methyltransferase
MHTSVIRRHYDEVIAPHYDLDPQSVIGDSLDRAIAQMRRRQLFATDGTRLNVLDIGMGTGRFLEKLGARAEVLIRPFGLDLSQKMIDVARARIPELMAAIADAANLDLCFPDESFDLISTHFVTGFVPISLLSPKIWGRLAAGGYWSFIGGTTAGFPALQRRANSKVLKLLFGGKSLPVDGLVCNPSGRQEVVQTLESNGFVIRESETFMPELHFANFREFLEFGYWGGWLTPFIEALGLQQAGLLLRTFLDAVVFPVDDHHAIEIILAQKVDKPSPGRS